MYWCIYSIPYMFVDLGAQNEVKLISNIIQLQ